MTAFAILGSTVEPMLTPDEVAAILHCSRSQVYDMLREQTFPFVRVGKLYRVRPSDLRVYLGYDWRNGSANHD